MPNECIYYKLNKIHISKKKLDLGLHCLPKSLSLFLVPHIYMNVNVMPIFKDKK